MPATITLLGCWSTKACGGAAAVAVCLLDNPLLVGDSDAVDGTGVFNC